ncbi:MAG: hypothetical protein AB2989_05695 [Candidatus Symbiodolus clandestinus]
MSTFFNSLLQKVGDKAKEALNYLVDEGSKKVKEWVTNLVKEAANQAVEWVSNALKSTIDSLADRVKASLLADPLAATTLKAPSKTLNAEDPE